VKWCDLVLSNGVRAKLDKDDYDFVSRFSWSCSQDGYAVRNVNDGKVTRQVSMARLILGLPNGDPRQVDHIDGDRLNNIKKNLRIVTSQENNFNKRKYRGSSFTSKYKGVSWDTSNKKWRARLKIDKKDIHIGRFESEVEAAKAYDEKAKELFKELAHLNFEESKCPQEPKKLAVSLQRYKR